MYDNDDAKVPRGSDQAMPDHLCHQVWRADNTRGCHHHHHHYPQHYHDHLNHHHHHHPKIHHCHHQGMLQPDQLRRLKLPSPSSPSTLSKIIPIIIINFIKIIPIIIINFIKIITIIIINFIKIIPIEIINSIRIITKVCFNLPSSVCTTLKLPVQKQVCKVPSSSSLS